MAYAATKQNMASGAAAYDLYSYSNAVRQPRQEQEVYAQPQARPQPKRKTALMNALFSLAALMGMILIVFSNARLNEAADAVITLENQLAVLQEEQMMLQSKYEKSVDLATIEEIATTQLGMGRPVGGQTVYVNLSGTDRAEVLAGNQGGLFGEISMFVTEAFSNLGEYLS